MVSKKAKGLVQATGKNWSKQAPCRGNTALVWWWWGKIFLAGMATLAWQQSQTLLLTYTGMDVATIKGHCCWLTLVWWHYDWCDRDQGKYDWCGADHRHQGVWGWLGTLTGSSDDYVLLQQWSEIMACSTDKVISEQPAIAHDHSMYIFFYILSSAVLL